MPRREYPHDCNTPELRAAYDESFAAGRAAAKARDRDDSEGKPLWRHDLHREHESHRKHQDHDNSKGRPPWRPDSQHGGESNRNPHADDPFAEISGGFEKLSLGPSAPEGLRRAYAALDRGAASKGSGSSSGYKESRSSHFYIHKAHDDSGGRPSQAYGSQSGGVSQNNPYASNPSSGASSSGGTSYSKGHTARVSIDQRILQDQSGYRNQHPVQIGGFNRSLPHPKPEEDLSIGTIKPYWYHPMDLEMTIRDNSLKPLMSNLLAGRPDLQKVVTTPLPNVMNENIWKPILKGWMMVFDYAYFFNLVEQVTGFPTFTSMAARGIPTESAGIACYDPRNRQLTFDMQAFHKDMKFHPRSLEFAVGTMLHEMLHAFQDLYGCRCHHCRSMHPNVGGLGATGHGPSWTSSMCELQISLQKAVPWKVCCAIQRSVNHEMRTSGWQPAPATMAVIQEYGD
jgi:hypothetical protein